MEKKISKYFFAVILMTLALVAFFLAAGTNELAAGTLISVLPKRSVDSNNMGKSKRAVTRRVPSVPNGRPILDRNIFDSTQSLEDEVPVEAAPGPLLADGELPLVPCTLSGVKLLATIASPNDPDWSFANVDVNGEKQMFRMGQDISGRTVSDITWRYLLLRGATDECYIDMFDQDAKAPSRTAAKHPAAAPVKDERITVNSETERTVDRSIVDQALANPTKFARSVRVRPYKKNGQVVGFRLRRVQRGSAIEQLGAKRGDILHSVNGIELKSIDDALAAYQKLRGEDQLVFSVTRRGKPVDLKINIQ